MTIPGEWRRGTVFASLCAGIFSSDGKIPIGYREMPSISGHAVSSLGLGAFPPRRRLLRVFFQKRVHFSSGLMTGRRTFCLYFRAQSIISFINGLRSWPLSVRA
jgi:hypothetical protein